MPGDWKASFVAMSAVVGVSLEEALTSLMGTEEIEATHLVRTLRSAPREARARAIAGVLAGVAAALDGTSATLPRREQRQGEVE